MDLIKVKLPVGMEAGSVEISDKALLETEIRAMSYSFGLSALICAILFFQLSIPLS
jgi:hypothetical protein